MSVEKWWNEICGRGKREKPRENPTQTPFPPPRNPHEGTETRTRDPSGGRRESNRLRHEAACAVYIVDNAKTFTSVGLSCRDGILFSKNLYMFDLVYEKSNNITC